MRTVTIISTLLLLSFSLQLRAAEDLPTPGSVYLLNGPSQENVYIIRHGLKEVSWSRDDRGQAVTSRRTEEIDRVELATPGSEHGYLRGTAAFVSRNWNNALAGYAEASQGSSYVYIRVDSHLKRAQALLKLKRYDEALDDAQAILTNYPDWVQVVDAMELIGQIHAAAGKTDEAFKAYQALSNKAKDFGPKYGPIATAKGALGEAGLLIAQDKVAAAVPLLRKAYAAVPISQAAVEHGTIAIALGDALVATNADSEAQNVFSALRYAPVGPRNRSKAFLALAKLEQKAGEKLSALDNFIIAAVIRGGDDATAAEAKRHARNLLKEYGEDESLDPKTQKEYRSYVSRL